MIQARKITEAITYLLLIAFTMRYFSPLFSIHLKYDVKVTYSAGKKKGDEKNHPPFYKQFMV
jgi:hypothetical protein